MQKALLVVSVLAALAFAGCGDKGEADLEPVTCPDGTVMSSEQLEAMPEHHMAGFNATEHCPVKPKVTLSGVPSSLTAFKKGPFSWTLDNGSVPHAHSMLTSIRYSSASVPDADLTAITKYPSELIKREHQNLPITYKGNLTFSKVGKVYLRAYMEVSGVDYWSPEVAIDVMEVAPTGKVVEFKIAAGTGVTGDITPPDQIVVLGDAIKVVNEDVTPGGHTCTWQSGPVQTDPVGDAEGAQESLVMKAPGTYEYLCDTLQPRGFKVIVNA
jgi:plastocyanin